MPFTYRQIEKAIHRSQHCQRNWDLSKSIPEEDLKLLQTSIAQCPSKQNMAFYSAHFITNRDLIEQIHSHTDGFTVTYNPPTSTTNPQVLANLLVVFESVDLPALSRRESHRNMETYLCAQQDSPDFTSALNTLVRDQNVALGIASGYLNLTASLLGYSTGCCMCFDTQSVKEVLNLENDPLLLMGIGFKNQEIGRRVHHLNPNFVFPTKAKQPIQVSVKK